MSNPVQRPVSGGSFVRQKDGTLKRVAGEPHPADAVPPQAATPASTDKPKPQHNRRS